MRIKSRHRPWIFFPIFCCSSTCFFAGFVFTGSHLVWDPFSTLSPTWWLQLLSIFTLSWLVFTSIFTSLCPAPDSFSNQSCVLASVWWQREEHICFWWFYTCADFGPLIFFLVIFNHCSHSPVTGCPTTCALAWHTVDPLSAFSFFSFLSLSFQKLDSISLYNLDLPYYVTLRTIPTPMMVLTEFLHVNTKKKCPSIASIMVFYFLFALVVSMFLYAYDVSSGNWFTFLKVLMLNVAMWTVFLHLHDFSLGLSSLADFLSPGAGSLTSAEHIPCLPAWMAMQFGHSVWIRVIVIFC